MNPLPARLLGVTDRHQAEVPLPRRVAALLAEGLGWIWLRDRDLPAEERRDLAEALAGLVRAAGATLSIGADVELAAAVMAGGVHLRGAQDVRASRRRLGRPALIGVSAHGLADLAAAKEAGADYATLSPIFASASKPGYGPALGLAALREGALIGLPVVALGGVTAETLHQCLDAGASGAAMMGPMMRGDARAIIRAFNRRA